MSYYNYVTIDKDNKFYCMASGNRKGKRPIVEQRLVMAQHLGRPLLPSELVHHKDGNKKNNRIENLRLMSESEHYLVTSIQMLKRYITHAEGSLEKAKTELTTLERKVVQYII